MEWVVSRRLDCRWMYTPLAVVHLHFTLRELHPGEVVELLINNEESYADVHSWSRMTGNSILQERRKESHMSILVQKT